MTAERPPSARQNWLNEAVAKTIPAKKWKEAILASFVDGCPMDGAYLEGYLMEDFAPEEVKEGWK